MNFKKILFWSSIALACFAGWTGFAQANPPGKPMPGGINNLDYLYVFGPRGRASAGHEDSLQINFYRVPATYSGDVTIYIFDPGARGQEDRRRRGIGSKPTTQFTVYGGAGAYSDPKSQANRPTSVQPGEQLLQKSFRTEHADEWIELGSFPVSKGEKVGGHVYFKLVVQAVSGSGSNFFGTAVTPHSAEAFSYNITAHLTADRGEELLFDVEVPSGTQSVTEHNYDLDRGGVSYLQTASGLMKLNRSKTGRWTQTTVANPATNGGRASYKIIKGSQGYANAGFYFTDANGKPLKAFYNPKEMPKPVPAPKPMASNECQIVTRLVTLTKRVPQEAALGQEYEMHMTVICRQQATDVVVTDVVPDGASYVSADVAPKVEGKMLTWNFGDMSVGDGREVRVKFKADKEGELYSCATIVAIPKTCLTTSVGRPVLAITKTGPEVALVGAQVAYNVVVKNTGTAVAKDVVVVDTIPDGLSHASGKNEVSFAAGDLAPQQSKSFTVITTANKRGRVCNKAVANSSNTPSVNAEACTVIQQPGLEVTKAGPKQQYLGKRATYQIVVKNTGDTVLNNVVVTDTAPAATRIVKADGANISGGTARWVIPSLKAGESKKLTAVLTSKVSGNHCNSVAVATSNGLTDSATACTVWKGYPALLLEVIDTIDPLLIDEQTTYVIRVTNQGTAPDTNITITARFPAEVSPVSASGASHGTVSGKTVAFKPYGKLEPKQSIEYRINAKAAQVGDSRLKVELGSDLLKTPVPEEESTHVY